jgi:hypothetical protein
MLESLCRRFEIVQCGDVGRVHVCGCDRVIDVP